MVSPGSPYSTLEQVKRNIQVGNEELGISDTDTDGDGTTQWDELLKGLQDRARSKIETFCQRDFAHHQGVTVTLDGKGKTVIRAPHPIISISSVSVDGQALTEGDDYIFKEGGSLVKTGNASSGSVVGGGTPPGLVTKSKPTWPDGYGNIEVTLTHGYQDPPGDVVDAEISLIDHTLVGYVSKREAPVVQTDDFSVSANIPISMNQEIKDQLRSYKPSGVGG